MEILENEKQIYDKLDSLGIDYSVIEHEPVYTAADLESIKDRAHGVHCKNLFFRNAKGDKYYLISCTDNAQVDVKGLKEKIGSTRLSFASAERLEKVLNLLPGSVNPFSLINDREKVVNFFIEKKLVGEDQLNFHPNVNHKTVTISYAGLEKYLSNLGVIINKVEL